MRRLVYPDWKMWVAIYYNDSLDKDFRITELLWELYDEGFTPSQAASYLRRASIPSGWLPNIPKG